MPVTSAEALDEIEAFRERFGLPPPPPPTSPTSLVEVREVIRSDELHRYPVARSYTDGQTGVDALTLRSLLELTSASGIRTVKRVLAEQRKQLETETSQLQLRSSLTDADRARLEDLQERVAAYYRVDRALLILFRSNLEAGTLLAKEVLRRFPNHSEGHVAAAFSHRLQPNWAKFGQEDDYLRANGVEGPVVAFLRAMAEWERGRRLESCRQRLIALRNQYPELIRVQAELVLLQDDIEETWAELKRLEQASPDHFLVRLAGPSIEREYQSARSIRSAVQ